MLVPPQRPGDVRKSTNGGGERVLLSPPPPDTVKSLNSQRTPLGAWSTLNRTSAGLVVAGGLEIHIVYRAYVLGSNCCEWEIKRIRGAMAPIS